MKKRRLKISLTRQSSQDPLTGKKRLKGWDMLEPDQELVKRNYTGDEISVIKRRKEAILTAIGMGMPLRDISKAYCVHHYTVLALVRAHPDVVMAGRERAGQRMQAYAGVIADSYMRDLANGNVKAESKPIAAGIFLDKGLALAGQATSIIEHRRAPLTNADTINSFWDRGRVVDAEVVTSDGANSALSSEPKQLEAATAADTALDTTPPASQAPGATLEVVPESAAGAPPAAHGAPTPDPRGGEGVEPAPRSTDG